jgi:HK97 gp10 family phage protein
MEGLQELDRRLSEISREHEQVFIKAAIKALRLRVMSRAKVKAPVDTGTLKRSLNVADPNHLEDVEREGDEIVIRMGTRVEYAPAVEYGHRVRTSGESATGSAIAKYAGGGGKMVRAQPFLRPAWDAGKDKVLDDIARDIAREIEKAVKK